MSGKYRLTLYVTGNTPRSERAIANLLKLCRHHLAGRYDLSIVDVLEDPETAEEERILVTPTLVKEAPSPVQRIIGDLSDLEAVLMGLDLTT